MTASTLSDRWGARRFVAALFSISCGAPRAPRPAETDGTAAAVATSGPASTGGTTASAGAGAAAGATGASGGGGPGGGAASGGGGAGGGAASGGGGAASGGGGAGGGPLDAGGVDGSDAGGADAGPVVRPRCDPGAAWGPGARVASLSASAFAHLGGVTPDELTVAWTDPKGEVYVADRADAGAAFGAPSRVAGTEGGILAPGRVALDPTGLYVAGVRADRRAFLAFARASRGAAWSASSGAELAELRAVFEGGGEAADPVLGADKRSLYFVVTRQAFPPSLLEARWDMAKGSWGNPSRLTAPELDGPDPIHRRRPTSASTDGRTLFFFDELTGVERAAWRDAPDAPFRSFADVGELPEAVPNLRCDALYYLGSDAGGAGVFVSE